jgi:ABC-type molybdenum transport system ATPase subunit/photorepair protein PhrA
MTGAEIDLRGVGFSHGPHQVLADVTLTVDPQTRLVVVGPNGVGTTWTWLRSSGSRRR